MGEAMRLEGRTILITGGTSGIGFELARRLLARKNTVLVTGRNEKRLSETATKLPGVKTFRCDVSEKADIAALFQRITGEFPALDILVNNAGIMRDVKITHDRSLDDVVEEIAIDLNGPIRMIQTFLPHLLEQQESAIVNVTSGLAFVPMPMSPIYSAAKAGLRAYTRSLRVQLAKSKVKVIEVAPPAADSDLYRRLAGDAPQSIKPMPVAVLADKIIAGLAAGEEEIAPGLAKALRLLGRLAPGFALKQMAKASGY